MSIAELSSKRIDARSSSLDVLLLQQLIPLALANKSLEGGRNLLQAEQSVF